MIKKVLIISAAVLAILLICLGVGVQHLLDSWGLGWESSRRMAETINRRLDADAAAVHDAEGPIRTPTGIAERGFVRIGGIDQWVTIRGDDRRNPAILVLHGGPGDAYSQLAYLLRPWERDFTVVQWDQRGAGRTYGRYGQATPDMTLNRMIEDGAEVADYARRRLGQKKIILLGHSWGSALGVQLLKRHPELFSAYVGTGQIVDTAELDADRYDYAMSRLLADHRSGAVAELRRLGPPPYRTDAQDEAVRKWLNRYLAEPDKAYLYTSVVLMMRNPNDSFADFQNLMKGHLSFSLPRMRRTYEAIDLRALGEDMPVPFFLIDGRDDRLTPPHLAEAYFRKIRAPQKAMILIGGGHFAFLSNASAFLDILVKRVRPEIMARAPESPVVRARRASPAPPSPSGPPPLRRAG